MTDKLHRYRLEGLEPDNLLAFFALLGLLRALEISNPQWRSRAAWDLDHPPLRAVLFIAEAATRDAICEATAEGIKKLVSTHHFGSATDLKFTVHEIALPCSFRRGDSRGAIFR